MERTKDAFRERLLRGLDAAERGNAAAREAFLARAPFGAVGPHPKPTKTCCTCSPSARTRGRARRPGPPGAARAGALMPGAARRRRRRQTRWSLCAAPARPRARPQSMRPSCGPAWASSASARRRTRTWRRRPRRAPHAAQPYDKPARGRGPPTGRGRAQDLALLERLWGAAAEWEALYAGWRHRPFAELDIGALQGAAAHIGADLQGLAPGAQAWPALQALQARLRHSLHNSLGCIQQCLCGRGGRAATRARRAPERVDAFALTMPLLADLRNPALRPRHWAELGVHIDARADPGDARFSLEAALGLRLDQHAGFIAALSAAATRQQAVERSLAVRAAAPALRAPVAGRPA